MKLDWGTVQAVAAVASPFILAGLAFVTWLYKHERERRDAAERQISERKRDAYVGLLTIFFDVLSTTKGGKTPDPKKLQKDMTDANKELILFGSDEVVKLYQKWVINARAGTADLTEFGDMIVAIRKDMGHTATSLTTDDVLRQFVVDYDDAKQKGGLVFNKGN
jgi:hypothetical protein